MSNLKPVLKTKHKNLTIASDRLPEYGDDVFAAVTFPSEYRNIQQAYPICFRKNEETGEFQSVALFGFELGENLFIKEKKWDASYIPLTIEIQPFVIGLDANDKENGAIYIDMDSPKVNPKEGGTRIFNQDGSESEYLGNVRRRLEMLHQMNGEAKGFYDYLDKFDLIEPFAIEVGLADGSERRLMGLYTLHEHRFHSLDTKVVEEMWVKGFMMPCFMMLASLASISDLVARKNLQLVD